MNYRKYNIKKKTTGNNLINFQDFVKYREEKEKIITNPFEENWKKAIVLEQLLQLYKPHQNHFVPNNPNYERKDFDSFYRHKSKFEEEDSMWENNEDNQIKKFHRMAEGINNYEQSFEDHKIFKTASKIDIRSKSRKQIEHREQKIKAQKKNKQLKTSKYQNIFFHKENLHQFQSFMEFREQERKSFTHFKKEIQRLHKKAVDQYGVNFQKPQSSVPSKSLDYQQYKNRQDAIFQKFISHSSSIKKAVQQKTQIQQKANNEPTVPLSLIKQAIRPRTSYSKNHLLVFKENKQKLSRKKYFRISD